MSDTIHEELSKLASEFTALRQSGRNKYPDDLWKAATEIANRLPLSEVCRAIKVQPAHLRKKISAFISKDAKESLTFLEIPQTINDAPKSISFNIETSCGHKLKIDGATTSHLLPVIDAFLKGGISCFK